MFLESQTRPTRLLLEGDVLDHFPNDLHPVPAQIVVGRCPAISACDNDSDRVSLKIGIHEYIPWRHHRARDRLVRCEYDRVSHLPIRADLTEPARHVVAKRV
jgi:hypothetical protein